MESGPGRLIVDGASGRVTTNKSIVTVIYFGLADNDEKPSVNAGQTGIDFVNLVRRRRRVSRNMAEAANRMHGNKFRILRR